MSKYPAQIDSTITLPTVVDNNSPVKGDTVNRLRDAIINIESELGVKPSGTFSTVRSRLDDVDARITAIQINELGGDLTGSLDNAKVIGLGGRPFADIAPAVSQVISWSGIAWVPVDLENVTVNVLPTSVVLPVDITFLSGDGYNNSANPFRIGSRCIDLSLYPASYPDGRTRTMTFKADLEVTNINTIGYVRIKDITHNAVIFDSTLSTDSITSVELEAEIKSGTSDGYIQEEACTENPTVYEAQIYVEGGNANDQVICRNARIEITYTEPILVTALVPLALPTDINFVTGTEMNGFATPASTGGRKLDMSRFPATLPDGRPRHVTFHLDAEVSASGVDGYAQLYDTTNDVVVTGTDFHFTNTLTQEYTVNLTVGSSDGMLRNDFSTRYEIRMWKVSAAPTDRVMCNNARITIAYYT